MLRGGGGGNSLLRKPRKIQVGVGNYQVSFLSHIDRKKMDVSKLLFNSIIVFKRAFPKMLGAWPHPITLHHHVFVILWHAVTDTSEPKARSRKASFPNQS